MHTNPLGFFFSFFFFFFTGYSAWGLGVCD